FAAVLSMLPQIVIATMCDSLQLLWLIGKRKQIFNVRGADGVMGALFRGLLARPELLRLDPQLAVPADANVPPILVPLRRFVRMAEELDLHLLELPAAEGVIARVDLVAEGLASLSNSERQFEPSAVEDVVEVDEDALGSLGAKIGHRSCVFQGTHEGLEHQVECTRLS